MSETLENQSATANPSEAKKPTGAYLFAVFVGVPLLIIVVVVALFALFAWLVNERRTVNDYLAAINTGSPEKSEQGARGLFQYVQQSKRWQTLFDMTQQVSFNREQFLKENPAFAAQVLNAFEDRGQDVKTRRYLALILGLVGDKSAVPALSAALKEDDSILVRNSLWVIGRVGDASTIPQIAPFTASDKPVLRLMAVFSLGSIDSSDTLPYLKSALNDNEHVIRWNAALLLAQRNDDSGKSVLTDLVRNEIQAASAPTGGRPQRYVDYFGRMPMEDDPNNPGLVTDDNKRACRIAAVQQLARIDPQGCLALIEEVSLHDADLVVRNAALRALPELKKRASQASQQTDFKP